MRYKVVPAPASQQRLEATRSALPLVPGSVEDCCTRIRDRTAVAARDEAREWLTFLVALDLAAETDRGYHRVRDPPTGAALRTAFEANVFGVRELLEALAAADGPLPASTAFERVREVVPRWERDRDPDWASEWEHRVELLLEWGVVFGLVAREESGYRPAE